MTLKKSAAKKVPRCPECGSCRVVQVVHGPMTLSLRKLISSGHAVLADREEWEGMAQWSCKRCGCDWSRHSRRFKKPGGVNATRSD